MYIPRLWPDEKLTFNVTALDKSVSRISISYLPTIKFVYFSSKTLSKRETAFETIFSIGKFDSAA